ncbi:TetR/AcrR family transcriptional regulator [Modestobacter sp. VKM Ac-2977]|uniref:TetR/AcrR family transcriptional regulator n=1 Tax=Modestobacter sp. VKM Ac-2977 TaxID=3004131 RepID=UPI0022AACEFA|nr:TetR/AcrR family transcriptional regulator [Modestobacter sp. VKM Ac-2977]MCZ2820364.1 TetR/AcrR family transcriptional regulator [Modestobacter sp. VKM Ac-2977]
MGDSPRAVGRPREFDVDEALDVAVRLFWERGYEGASLADLTGAMGISKPSFYAAFGSKEQLFRRALDRYTEGPASYGLRALEEPTARQVVAAFFDGAVRATTPPEGPAGCLGVQGALASSSGGQAAHDVLAGWRNDAGDRLAERFRRAVKEGDLPSDADPQSLARYVMAVGFGIAVQAASGVSRQDLQLIADVALQNWRP